MIYLLISIVILQAICLGAIAMIWESQTDILTLLNKTHLTVEQEIERLKQIEATRARLEADKAVMNLAKPPPAFYVETKV